MYGSAGKNQSAASRLPIFSEGFVSGYFLAILLYCTILFSLIVQNDKNRLQVMMNMDQFQKRQMLETEVLAQVKCALKEKTLESGTITTTSGTCEISVSGSTVILYMNGEADETMILTINPEGGKITGWQIAAVH